MGYRGKVAQQGRARDLRALGWTLAEIAEELGVSRSSASLWCRDVELDEAALAARRRERYLRGNEGARRRGPNALQRRKAAEIDAARRWARDLVGELTERDLLVAGAMLYAGEGAKRDGCVRLANSDPRLIRLFLVWLRRFFDVDESRLRVQLYLHAGLDLEEAMGFWADLTEIPLGQFTKPYRAVPDPSIRAAKHPMGCPAVVYSSVDAHRRVSGLVAALLTFDLHCEVAQPVEQGAVNSKVLGSSPSLAAPDGVA